MFLPVFQGQSTNLLALDLDQVQVFMQPVQQVGKKLLIKMARGKSLQIGQDGSV